MLKRTVHSKQGVRSNGRNDDRGPQPSLELAQNSMGRRWDQVADKVRVVSGLYYREADQAPERSPSDS